MSSRNTIKNNQSDTKPGANNNANASGHPLATPASNVTHRETLPSSEELRVICFACYVDHAIQNTINLLKTVSELQATNGKEKDIEDGVIIAELTLEELLDELRLKHHGEGLPQGGVPVRPIPFPVPPEEEADEKYGKEPQK
jgi:hypothetical protein